MPSGVALVLSQQQRTRKLADDVGRCMRLDEVDRELIHQEIVGAVAMVINELPHEFDEAAGALTGRSHGRNLPAKGPVANRRRRP